MEKQQKTPADYCMIAVLTLFYGFFLGAGALLLIGLFMYCMFGGWFLD